jgi:hypothetical protein
MVYGNVEGKRLERRPLIWGSGRDWELKDAADEVFGIRLQLCGQA